MINAYMAKLYCSEDIALIENYQQAISDEERMWDVHHRRECDSEGRTLFTGTQLKEMGLYFNRPAAELIFVTRSMHCKLHREMFENIGKNVGKKYGQIGRKIGGKKTGAINGKKGAIKHSIPILQFSKDGSFVKEWPSLSEAERRLGILRSSISACLKGYSKSAGGYIWRYANG